MLAEHIQFLRSVRTAIVKEEAASRVTGKGPGLSGDLGPSISSGVFVAAHWLRGGFRFAVSGRPRPGAAFCSPALPGGKITLALGGLFRMAVAQSVGAGCRLAGTLSIQMRHIPGGGRYSFGTGAFFSASFWRRESGGASDCDAPTVGKRSITVTNRKERNCIDRAYPING